jgi:CHAD domain-containing protein
VFLTGAAVPHATTGPLATDATIGEVVRAAIAAGHGRLLLHDPGLRRDGDVKAIHQARVATRRLRSDLRTFADLLDGASGDALRDELRWLGQQLGSVRDDDVLLKRLERQIATLPAADAAAAAGLTTRLREERDAHRLALRAALEGDRYPALLDAVAAAAEHPPFAEGASVDRRARNVLPKIVRRPWRHLEQAVNSLPAEPDDADLHEVRIRAKRTRYAAEAAAPLLGKPAARFARATARLQRVLGDLQDAVVAEAWLRAAARRGPSGRAFGAGILVRIEREEIDAARRAWPQVWDELDRKRLRAWLS